MSLPVLTPRHQGPAVTPMPSLTFTERICNAVAAAGEIVPGHFRDRPGAVMLAKMWADANDVDLLTAVQNLSIMDGRLFVSAALRVQMATRLGFEFRPIESTREVCTLEVWREECKGSVTCRFDDQPRRLKYKSGAPTPWSLYADDMLFAEACRKADRRFVKTASALIDSVRFYEDDGTDALAVLEPPAPPTEAHASGEEAWDALERGEEAQVDQLHLDLDADAGPVTVDYLVELADRHGLGRSKPALLKQAMAMGYTGGTLADLAADSGWADKLMDWIELQ